MRVDKKEEVQADSKEEMTSETRTTFKDLEKKLSQTTNPQSEVNPTDKEEITIVVATKTE